MSVLDASLKLETRMLHPGSELRRIFGSTPGAPKTRVIKRKHWLVEPDKNWPMVVRDTFRMEVCFDGSHRLVPEPDYEAKLKTLMRIVVTHDVEALYQFVQFNPFHPHGLIQLATILIEQRSEFENAYQLVRRALFAYQSAFSPSFHPTKSLIVTKDSIFTASMLRALLLYAHLLAGQGCVRTSLEVLKLLYAMEGGMITGSPTTHALMHIDTAAFRAEQYDWLSEFLSENGLTDVFPGSSLLFAISQKIREVDSDVVATIPKSVVMSNRMNKSTPATTALVRTILMFPSCVKLVLNRDMPGVTRTTDPFTNKLVHAFGVRGLPAVKANDQIIAWMNSVVDKVLPMTIKETGLTSLPASKPEWLTNGYSNITSAEFEWGKSASGTFVEPEAIRESEVHILEVYSEEGYVPATTRAAPRLGHAVSLESNPVAAFFETLLPWSRVDVTGTESNPVTVRGLLEQLQTSLGLGRGDVEDAPADPVIQEAAHHWNGSQDGSESSDDDDEEIQME